MGSVPSLLSFLLLITAGWVHRPLMVAVGAAESGIASRVYHEDNFFGGISVSSFMFGGS
jgi:hypothetical protein